MTHYLPEQVVSQDLRPVISPLPYWFVIGGNAVRCLCPYRPTRDIDFGVSESASLSQLLSELQRSGSTQILEQNEDTAHLRWNTIPISIFVLEEFAEFTVERRLTVEGILASKLHAILDRGTRRDFFDLYVTMQQERRSLADCLRALRTVYRQPINDTLLLRALTYFDDANREAPLPGEGRSDWNQVRDFFLTRAGHLLVPPGKELAIQKLRVDVSED